MFMPRTLSSAPILDVGHEAELGIVRASEMAQITHPLG
jgi:hypothetical protein